MDTLEAILIQLFHHIWPIDKVKGFIAALSLEITRFAGFSSVLQAACRPEILDHKVVEMTDTDTDIALWYFLLTPLIDSSSMIESLELLPLETWRRWNQNRISLLCLCYSCFLLATALRQFYPSISHRKLMWKSSSASGTCSWSCSSTRCPLSFVYRPVGWSLSVLLLLLPTTERERKIMIMSSSTAMLKLPRRRLTLTYLSREREREREKNDEDEDEGNRYESGNK